MTLEKLFNLNKVRSTAIFVERMINRFQEVQRTVILLFNEHFIKEDIAVRCTWSEYIIIPVLQI